MFKLSKKQYLVNRLATFDMTPTAIKRSTDLTPTDKNVYGTIYSTLMEHHPFYQGNQYIADHNGISKFTVQKSLRTLKNKGYIKVGYQRKQSKQHNTYITKRVITGLDSSKLFSSKKEYKKALKKVSKLHRVLFNTHKSHSNHTVFNNIKSFLNQVLNHRK